MNRKESHRIKTNHIQSGDMLQCQWIQDQTWDGKLDKISIIKNMDKHFQDFCLAGCPYYEGNYQGNGVECSFYDGTNIPVVINPNPWILRSMTLTIAAKRDKGIAVRNRKEKLGKLKDIRHK